MAGGEIMTQIVVTGDLERQLSKLTGTVELRNAAGKVLGRFMPVLDAAEYDLNPNVTPEELERRRVSGEKTYTTQEVLRHLESLS
jgi:hypothetical protein